MRATTTPLAWLRTAVRRLGRPALSAAAPLLLAVAASGHEVRVSDVRVDMGVIAAQVEMRGTIETTPAGGSTTSVSGEREDRVLALREGLQYVRGDLTSSGGWLYGAAFAVTHAHYRPSGVSNRMNGPTVDLQAGWGLAPLGWLHLEAMPFAGVGYSFLRIDQPTGDVIHNRSYVYEAGLRLGLYATADRTWQAGLEIPLLLMRSRPKYAQTTAAGDLIVSTERRILSGAGVMLGLGLRY